MPFDSIIVDNAGDMTEKIASLSVSKNTLVAATVTQEPTDGNPAHTYCVIDITHSNSDEGNRVAILAAGYLGGHYAIAWTGKIQMESDMFVNVRSFSQISNPVRLSTIMEK